MSPGLEKLLYVIGGLWCPEAQTHLLTRAGSPVMSLVAESLLLLVSCGLVRPALCLAASNIWLPFFCLCVQLWCSLMTALLWCAVGRACTQTGCQLWLMQLLAGLGMLGAAGPQGNAEAKQVGRWKVSELALINIWLVGLRKVWESDICQHSVFCRELPWTPTPLAHSQKARKSFTLLFLLDLRAMDKACQSLMSGDSAPLQPSSLQVRHA